MKASIPNYRQSPRKVRLVADLIKGKKVKDAELALSFLPKRAATPLLVLLRSAVANATQNSGIKVENLVVSDVRVDKGVTMKRFMPRARGSASRINKRSSHVLLVLSEKVEKVKAVKAKTSTAKKAAPKKAKKVTE
ncbi:MAG: 50S ribosomal protein L22 [Candidatus Pacebacteria bacterium]|nr:50S ribosomal protein L22 [Candidatus Paceibacterota bacterium]MBP9772657.1 50S ribosomal protein L22 [Candidatus Paceibacterota bacterium]